MFDIISQAHAADAVVKAQQPSLLVSLAPLMLIMAVFYFLLIRPQQKRLKDHQGMIEKLSKGDKVVTAGGILGSVVKIEENNFALIEIADNVKVKVRKDTISEIITNEPQAKAA